MFRTRGLAVSQVSNFCSPAALSSRSRQRNPYLYRILREKVMVPHLWLGCLASPQTSACLASRTNGSRQWALCHARCRQCLLHHLHRHPRLRSRLPLRHPWGKGDYCIMRVCTSRLCTLVIWDLLSAPIAFYIAPLSSMQRDVRIRCKAYKQRSGDVKLLSI